MNPNPYETPESNDSYGSYDDSSSSDDQQAVAGPGYLNVMPNTWLPGPGATQHVLLQSVEGGDPGWHDYYNGFVPPQHQEGPSVGGATLADNPVAQPREASMPPESTSAALAGDQSANPTLETQRVQVTERHMVDLDAKADEDHFKSFTDELEKMVRVNLALNPQPGILDNAERELLRGYLANPDNLNETLFRDACRGESLGGGDLAAFKHLITFTHQMSASLKHIALYIQTCLQGDANPSIPSSGDLRKMLLFMQLILPPINRLRIRTAPVEGWNPTSGFIYGQ